MKAREATLDPFWEAEITNSHKSFTLFLITTYIYTYTCSIERPNSKVISENNDEYPVIMLRQYPVIMLRHHLPPVWCSTFRFRFLLGLCLHLLIILMLYAYFHWCDNVCLLLFYIVVFSLCKSNLIIIIIVIITKRRLVDRKFWWFFADHFSSLMILLWKGIFILST